jgi:hypothetical protein
MVGALLNEASETHHLDSRRGHAHHPDWASWYADWLLQLSELPQILAKKPVRSELVWLLVELDNDYERMAPDTPWPEWYAARIIERFGLAGANAPPQTD